MKKHRLIIGKKESYKKRIRRLAVELPREKRQEILDQLRVGKSALEISRMSGLQEDVIHGVFWINLKKVPVLNRVTK